MTGHGGTNDRTVIVFGGTFDPPHRAHLTLPLLAADAIAADHVLFVPAGCNPQKMDRRPTSGQHRIAMLEAALAGDSRASVSSIEVDREGATYMVDTLRQLRAMERWQGVRLRLLIGADQALNFRTWKAWEEIVTLAEPLIMPRGDQDVKTLLEALKALFPEDPATWCGRVLDLPRRSDRSEEIRSDLSEEIPLEDQLTPEVAAYIHRHGLYEDGGVDDAAQ